MDKEDSAHKNWAQIQMSNSAVYVLGVVLPSHLLFHPVFQLFNIVMPLTSSHDYCEANRLCLSDTYMLKTSTCSHISFLYQMHRIALILFEVLAMGSNVRSFWSCSHSFPED